MRIFISEAVCGGGWPGDPPDGSLRREGEAMLTAVVGDFARLEGCRVVATWDARLGPYPGGAGDIVLVASPEEERDVFKREAARAEATLVIAPEFHDMLAARAETVLAAGGRLLGPSPDVVRLCGDKLALARRLTDADPELPVIPTFPLPATAQRDVASARVAWPTFPLVIKPRHGAGSVNTFLVPDLDALRRVLSTELDPPDLPPTIMQPYVAGRALSVAGFFASHGQCELLPVAEQIISSDGRFQYLGSRVPAADVDERPIHDLVRRIARVLGGGLRGYVGFDLLLPREAPTRPLLVEINPRLTTSYLSYQTHCHDNLAARVLRVAGMRVELSES